MVSLRDNRGSTGVLISISRDAGGLRDRSDFPVDLFRDLSLRNVSFNARELPVCYILKIRSELDSFDPSAR